MAKKKKKSKKKQPAKAKKPKAKKKAKKVKQPTKAEIEAMRKERDFQLDCEKTVVSSLHILEQVCEREDVHALIRAYRRKWHEANDLKRYLGKLREWFKECWDEEDEHFDPSYASDGMTSRYDWCPNLIEEIGEMIEEGTVYTDCPIPAGAGA